MTADEYEAKLRNALMWATVSDRGISYALDVLLAFVRLRAVAGASCYGAHHGARGCSDDDWCPAHEAQREMDKLLAEVPS